MTAFWQQAQCVAIPSPNIWHWPQVYEIENKAQDADGQILAVLGEITQLAHADVVDIGCGTGFHLPFFAQSANSVTGVEPHPKLAQAARRRTEQLSCVRVLEGFAEKLPLADDSADVIHARTAYFFGPGCEAGIAEAFRVLRPGGQLIIIDLDASYGPYGSWMLNDIPHYDPAAVEKFFTTAGFETRRVDTVWRFQSRKDLRDVLGIEFTKSTAEQAFSSVSGLSFTVRYRIHWQVKTAGLLLS
ncbi:MAG: class I SAM-dependent methyltransferase [Mycobacteriaceae bacterium]